MRNSQLKVALGELSDIEVFFRLKIEKLNSDTTEPNHDYIVTDEEEI